MYKHYDNRRTKVALTYFTQEPAESIIDRVKRDGGAMQNTTDLYNVETLTITEIRTVRFAQTPPKDNTRA
jgi:hypothetical protein